MFCVSKLSFPRDTANLVMIIIISVLNVQVVVDAIESNQHGFLWRALTVVLYQQSLQSEENQAARDKLNALLADKEDVVISRDCSFGVMDFEKEKSISVSLNRTLRVILSNW